MKHLKETCKASDLIIACTCGLACANCGACNCEEHKQKKIKDAKDFIKHFKTIPHQYSFPTNTFKQLKELIGEKEAHEWYEREVLNK